MNGYTKIFANILDSTVWGLSKEARLLWITMLVKKDKNQIVRCSVPGLAHAARLSVNEVQTSLEELLAPDPFSQSKEQEGKRIVAVDGGWFIINGAKYRDMLSKAERREYQARWQADYRKRGKSKRRAKDTGMDGRPASGAYKAAESAEVRRHENGLPSACD